MEKYPVVDTSGKKVGEIELNPSIFGFESRPDLVHDVVVWQRNCARRGTHDCIHKGEMEASSKKPYKQKGTGRARAGGVDSPLWVGGAVAHGPRPRSYETRVTKRRRKEGLFSVLSDKVREKKLVVIDSFGIESPKTKSMEKILKNVCQGSALVVADSDRVPVGVSTRNLKFAKYLDVAGVNTYDLLKKEYFVCSKEALEKLQKEIA